MAVLLLAAPAAGQEADKVDAAAKKLIAANGFLARRMVSQAAREYEEFLAKYANHAQVTTARYGLAICRFRQGQFDKAAPLLDRVLKDRKFKQADEALAVLGHCHLSGKAYDKALAAFDELLKKHPGSRHAEVAALNRAQVLYMQGRHDDAVAACKAFVRKYPSSARRTSAEYSLALAQFALQRHKEAAETLARVVRQPNAPVALDAALLLGQCHEALNKFTDAADQYRRAIQIAPPDRQVEARYSLGVALYKAGDHKAAIKALAPVVSSKSAGRYALSARFQLGLAELASGKVRDARKTLAEVIKTDPARAPKARYWLAQCDMTEKKFDAAYAALDALAKAKKRPANLDAVLYDRAVCAMSLGRYDRGAEQFAEFRKAYPEKKDPKDPKKKDTRFADSTYRQAFCLHKLTKYAESYELSRRVASQTGVPVAPAAAELTAENLFLLAKYPEAARAYQELAKLARDEHMRLRVAFRLSQCAYFRGDYAKAIELARPLAANRKVAADASLRQAIFLLGDAQLQAGQHAEAARTLAKYLPLAGKDKAEAQFKLGLAQLRAGGAATAAGTFEELARKDGKSTWGLRAAFEYAQLAYKQDKPKKAEPMLARLLAAKPPDEILAPALYLQAWLDFDAKRFAAAADRFGQVARRFKSHALAAESSYQQAVSLVEDGKFKEALPVLRAYVKAHADGKHAAQARHHEARCLSKLGQHAEAARLFATLAADKKNLSEDLLYELAWAQRESKHADAGKAYRRLLDAFPSGKLATTARAELAELLYAQRKYAEAAKLLDRVVADKSAPAKTLSVARYRLGWCYDKLGEPAKAADAFSAFAARGSDSEFAASAMYQAGVAYAKLQKFTDAQRQFTALVGRFPKHDLTPVAMLKLGEVQAQAQDYERSAQTYTEFLRKYTGNKFAFLANFGLGWSLENRRKYEDARRAYAKVVADHNGPTAARAQFQIGECYFAESKFDKAAGELLKVEIVYAYPEWSARALYEAGRAFEALKQVGQAKSQYAACVKKYKDSAPAAQAAKRLKDLGGAP